MTFFHLVNCTLSTFGPYAVIYQASSLSSSSNSLFLCGATCLCYLLTQLVKCLLLVTAPNISPLFVFVYERLLYFLDIPGILIALRLKLAGQFETNPRILAVGLSWSFAEVAVQSVLPLIVEARAAEFTWKFVYRSSLCHLLLLTHLGSAALLQMSERTRRWKDRVGAQSSGLSRKGSEKGQIKNRSAAQSPSKANVGQNESKPGCVANFTSPSNSFSLNSCQQSQLVIYLLIVLHVLIYPALIWSAWNYPEEVAISFPNLRRLSALAVFLFLSSTTVFCLNFFRQKPGVSKLL